VRVSPEKYGQFRAKSCPEEQVEIENQRIVSKVQYGHTFKSVIPSAARDLLLLFLFFAIATTSANRAA